MRYGSLFWHPVVTGFFGSWTFDFPCGRCGLVLVNHSLSIIRSIAESSSGATKRAQFNSLQFNSPFACLPSSTRPSLATTTTCPKNKYLRAQNKTTSMSRSQAVRRRPFPTHLARSSFPPWRSPPAYVRQTAQIDWVLFFVTFFGTAAGPLQKALAVARWASAKS